MNVALILELFVPYQNIVLLLNFCLIHKPQPKARGLPPIIHSQRDKTAADAKYPDSVIPGMHTVS